MRGTVRYFPGNSRKQALKCTHCSSKLDVLLYIASTDPKHTALQLAKNEALTQKQRIHKAFSRQNSACLATQLCVCGCVRRPLKKASNTKHLDPYPQNIRMAVAPWTPGKEHPSHGLDPPLVRPDTRTITFHNQRDFVFFRHYRCGADVEKKTENCQRWRMCRLNGYWHTAFWCRERGTCICCILPSYMCLSWNMILKCSMECFRKWSTRTRCIIDGYCIYLDDFCESLTPVLMIDGILSK